MFDVTSWAAGLPSAELAEEHAADTCQTLLTIKGLGGPGDIHTTVDTVMSHNIHRNLANLFHVGPGVPKTPTVYSWLVFRHFAKSY